MCCFFNAGAEWRDVVHASAVNETAARRTTFAVSAGDRCAREFGVTAR